MSALKFNWLAGATALLGGLAAGLKTPEIIKREEEEQVRAEKSSRWIIGGIVFVVIAFVIYKLTGRKNG
jgi:hypothetical protein